MRGIRERKAYRLEAEKLQAEFEKSVSGKVDKDTFLYCLEIYCRAGAGEIHHEPVQGPEFEFEGDVYALADTPQNRAAQAVREACSHLDEDQARATMFRIFSLEMESMRLSKDPRFAEHFTTDGDLIGVSHDFLVAYALAPVKVDPVNLISIDEDGMLEIISEIERMREEAA